MEIAYEPGVATFVKTARRSRSTYEIFVPPDFPGDMRLLTLTNRGDDAAERLRIAPFFDMALDESPNESVGHLDETVGDGVLLFQNRRNDFVRGVAFVATTLREPATETIAQPLLRRRRARHPHARRWSRPARRTLGARDDGRRVAAFCGEIELPAGDEARIAIGDRHGADARGRARRGGARRASPKRRSELAATRAHWASGSAWSRSRPTGPTSTGSSTPGCPISSMPRGCSAASAPTSAAARPAIATSCRTCCR